MPRKYQKEGFLVISSSGSVTDNVATGAGVINYTATNGFELDGSNLSAFSGNRTELNQYAPSTYDAAGYIVCATKVDHRLLDSHSTSLLAKSWHNLSWFNDLPYYISKNANCS